MSDLWEKLRRPAAVQLRNVDWPQAIVANLLVFGVLVYAKVLRTLDSDLFYRSLQEDEALEWATFWAFLLAALAALIGAVRQRSTGVKIPWFLAGVSLFCFVVAMEEISWGQRLLGYRPPEYFLAENFQQELNIHNVVSTDLRKQGLKAVILGYGVVLPLLALVPPIERMFRRVAITAPSWTLIPSFLAAFVIYREYRWKFTGELVELMLGLAFLFALLEPISRFARFKAAPPSSSHGWLEPLRAWLVVVVLGVVTATGSQALTKAHPAKLQTTQTEVDALLRDFQSLSNPKCPAHKRIYSYSQKYPSRELEQGQFAALIDQGLPEERASFYLDPWNSPYWIRHRCTDDGETTLIILYSFGPNRKRDSTRTEVLGDDIAAVFRAEDHSGD